MELPVIIEPMADRTGFVAHLAAPFQLMAEAPTAEQAHERLVELLQQRMQHGLALRAIHVPTEVQSGAEPGWLPDDELTREWLKHMQQFRDQCDAEDRSRLLSEREAEETSAGFRA